MSKFAALFKSLSEIVETPPVSVDTRARFNWLPFCPLCSFVGIEGRSDILHAPAHRSFNGLHTLIPCCFLSEAPKFDSQGDAAKWWRAKRLDPVRCQATENRRRECIEKLKQKGLDPIE